MVGIDKNTGKPIEEAEHIRQSIETILTTPQGTRVMREGFGVDFLDKDGKPLNTATDRSVRNSAARALAASEPLADDIVLAVEFLDHVLHAITVYYAEVKTGERKSLIVNY